MSVKFPNHELGSRARVIVGGEVLLGTLIGQWQTGVRVEVEAVMQHRLRDRTEANAFEAGRLAAIRAEVEYFVWLVDTMPTEMGAEPFSKRRRRELAKLRAQAADCRRWLEETR